MLKRLQNFIGGLHKTDNKSLVASNRFVDGKNLIPQSDATLLKRKGRDLISQVITDQNKLTGLIQNETEGGVKELFAITVTDIYQNVSGTVWDSKFSGFTDFPFNSAYWQNKAFWGNGQEDIIATLDNLINLRLYVTESGNSRVSIFDKKNPYVFDKTFGQNGSSVGEFDLPRGIAVDSDKIYVSDFENTRVQIFNKATGVFLASFATTTKPRAIDVDAQWIYISGLSGSGTEIEVYDKTTPYAKDRGRVSGDINDLVVDEQFLYVSYALIGVGDSSIYDKITLVEVGLFSSDRPVGIAVDRAEFDTNYIYAGGNADLKIINKTSPYAEVGSIPTLSDQITGITVDNQYIYFTLFTASQILVYDKSLPTPNLVATISQAGNLGGSMSTPRSIDMEKIAQNDKALFIGYLDAPARPLAFWDVTGGNVGAGTYNYKMTLSDGTNETNVSQEGWDVVVSAALGKVWIQLAQTSIPSDITHWVLYRKKDAGEYHQLASVNITDVDYLDDIAEATIVNNSAYPANSTLHPFLTSSIFTFYQESLWILKGKTLYWSGSFAPNDFPSDNTLVIDTKTDGSGIHGSEIGMFIFTKNSFAILEGWDIDNYTYRELSSAVGTIAHRSIKEYLKTVIWLDRNGIFISNGTQPVKISEPFIDEIIDSIQADKVKYLCAEVFNDKYILSVPTTSGNDYNDKVIVYDFVRKCFYVFDWIIHDFALVEDANDNLLLYMGGKDSAIYSLFVGNADDDETGTPQDIDCELETKHFDLDDPDVLKWFHNLMVIAGNDGSNNVTMNFKWKVGDNTEETREITVSRLKQVNEVRPKGGRGTKIYFKITESGQQEFKIYGFTANLDVLAKSKINNQGG